MRIAVTIGIYNEEINIAVLLQLLITQTRTPHEIIIVDDGSTDKTEEIVKSFNDKRIRYIRHRENRGAPAARNTGIRIAKGEYISFHDSDDEWLPEKLEKEIKIFQKSSLKVGVVYSGLWKIRDGKKEYFPSSNCKKNGDLSRVLLKENIINPEPLVKRECFNKVGLCDESLLASQDWELWIRISKYYHFRYIDEPLVLYYSTEDSISRKKDGAIKAYRLILKKHFVKFKRWGEKKLLAMHYYTVGTNECAEGDMTLGRRDLLFSFTLWPQNTKLLLRIAI